MTLLPTSACTHDCDQGDLCTCARPQPIAAPTATPTPTPLATDEAGLWIRIPDLIMLMTVMVTIGVIVGVQLVRMGMTA